MIFQGSAKSSVLETYRTADEAINSCVAQNKLDEKAKQLLMKLRTSVFTMIRKKVKADQEMSKSDAKTSVPESDAEKGRSNSDAENAMRNFNLNIYVNENQKICRIGEGGTLLVLNIIEGELDCEWNDVYGKIEGFTPGEVKDLGKTLDKIGA